MNLKIGLLWVGAFALILAALALAKPVAAEHPSLLMTKAGVQQIRAELGKVPLFDTTIQAVKAEVDAEIDSGIHTPIPRDYSGGYTHERHKQNFFVIQKAGALYQILDDEKYAQYVRDMLFQYEAMYGDLPLHPQTRSYARGKIFWQCLNDANWLLYVSQAYDAIYDWLSEDERLRLEQNLFRPFADHISIDNPQFFNRVHNHSTWGAAAVGMIALVMDDEELLERALYGIPFEDIDYDAKDDDGGFIYSREGKAGFLANMEEPFSPDGYHTEGPYYQRYAMSPFLVFAQALHNVKPELEVFEHKDRVLLKGVEALLNLSDADGEFFPLNDGQKGMSYLSRELVQAVNIAYFVGDEDPSLLSIAQEQGQVQLDDAGFAVALAVRDGLAKPFVKTSINFSDGADGDEGGVAVLRRDDLELVFKYAAQGLSHGHYDKLSYSLYESGDEILQDYGLARFVNIEQKGGGNYLPENTSWAKQTIAHNTLVQNQASHFGGSYDIGSQHHSELVFFDVSNEDVQVVSAYEDNAYPGTRFTRTFAMIADDGFENSFLLDLMRVDSDSTNQYDLPFYYLGQVMKSNFDYESPEALAPWGEKNGYQHLYLEGMGAPSSDNLLFSWMADGKFHSMTAAVESTDEIYLVRTGANDPEFNLRRDPGLVLRRNETEDTIFASLIEVHGSYSPVSELAINSNSSVAKLSVLRDDADYTVVEIEGVDDKARVFFLSNADSSPGSSHRIEVKGTNYEWSGPFHYAN